MDNKIKNNSLDELFDAVLSLENKDECYDFFYDLCTRLELKSLSQRFQVAKMLSEGCVYNEIVSRTGASTAIVSRVKRSLDDGGEGYRTVFERMNGGKNEE